MMKFYCFFSFSACHILPCHAPKYKNGETERKEKEKRRLMHKFTAFSKYFASPKLAVL